MSNTGVGQLITRTTVHVAIAVLAAIIWFIIGLPAWNAYHTDIAFNSLLAFIAITCISIAYLASRDRFSPFLIMMQGFLFFAATLHTGFALDTIFRPETAILLRSSENLFSDLLELSIIGVFLLFSIWVENRWSNFSTRKLYGISITTSIILLLTYGTISEHVFFTISESVLPFLGIPLAVFSALSIAITIFLAFRSSRRNPPYNPIALIAVCSLFALSTITILVPLWFPSLIWTLSVTLHSVAFFILYLSIAVPYLLRGRIEPLTATVYASGLSILFITPFIITLIVEGLAPGFHNPSWEAYVIIHSGAASLSAVMAFLTYGHSKTQQLKNLYPLILLFSSWTVVDVSQVILLQIPSPHIGESLVPYITGSIVSLITLYWAIRWTIGKPPTKTIDGKYWPFLGVSIQILLVVIGELIQLNLVSIVPALINSPLGRSVLLVINLFAMLEFALLIVYLSKESKGTLSVDVLLIGFMALWILPNILKANYLDWTAGWYSAEILLLVALLFGPSVIAILYLKEKRKAEISHQQARVNADLLIHDVSNYHQAILISLGLIEVDGVRSGLQEDSLKEAKAELTRADQLIRNVRQLGKLEELGSERLSPIDLVETILVSFSIAVPARRSDDIHFSIDRETGECYVRANSLLEEIFINLIRNSVQYSSRPLYIDVEINEVELNHRNYWQTRLTDNGIGIEPKRKVDLFNRFMIGAKGIGLGLSVVKTLVESFYGFVEVENRVANDYTQGTVFIISIPCAEYG